MPLPKVTGFAAQVAEVEVDPTTGGVSASLGMLGDLNLAEPLALIGFAGSPFTVACVPTGMNTGVSMSP